MDDCKDEGGDCNADNFMYAVHGTVYRGDDLRRRGDQNQDKRRNNGYWGRPDSRRRPNLSAAVLLPRPHLWDCESIAGNH